jgi:hypothetical protein
MNKGVIIRNSVEIFFAWIREASAKYSIENQTGYVNNYYHKQGYMVDEFYNYLADLSCVYKRFFPLFGILLKNQILTVSIL